MSWKPPEGLNPELKEAFEKVFEKYRLGNKAMLCLWNDGQLSTAVIHEPSLIPELRDRLNECLEQLTRNQENTADEDREAIERVLDRYMEWL